MQTESRFDRLLMWPARLVLAVLLVLLAAAAMTPLTVGKGEVARPPALTGETGAQAHAAGAARARDDDLRLYDAVIARLTRGEGYYDVIAEEHRKLPFPLKPGFAVRLPTLAVLAAWLGPSGLAGASVLLAAAIGWAWWRRLAWERTGRRQRLIAMVMLLGGANFVLVRYFHVLHELWAGGLLALAFALHRPGERWLAAAVAAALALAIRETALPFVLLGAAYAFWRRDWREGAAWSVLAVSFVAAWAWHLHVIALLARPEDPLSAPWLTLRGLSGLLSLYVLPTPLRFLPSAAAGPIVVLCLLGWSSWKAPAGSFGALLLLGYGLAFMIAGRPENWYWGALVTPVLFMGLAFLPAGLAALWRQAQAR